MAAFATAKNVADRLGVEHTAQEVIRTDSLLEDVADEIRSRLPSIDTWIADGKVTAGIARKVSVDIVEAYLNGSGLGVRSRAHPEMTDQYTDAAANGLVPTEEQLSQLTPSEEKEEVRRERGRAFSIIPR
jgi:hypothetical protein